MDIDDRTRDEIMDLIDTFTRDEFEALAHLSPDCASPDPLKGDWEKMGERQYATYSKLFRAHMIDSLGNLTALGLDCARIEQEETDNAIEQGVAEMEMLELDELDRQCRQRPNRRQPPAEFNYGEDVDAGPSLLLP